MELPKYGNDYYIYNMQQADWLIKQKCPILGIGIGDKNKRIYVLFKRNLYTEQKVTEWKLREH